MSRIREPRVFGTGISATGISEQKRVRRHLLFAIMRMVSIVDDVTENLT